MRRSLAFLMTGAVSAAILFSTAAMAPMSQDAGGYAAVLGDTARPEADRARDAARKTAETPASAEVEPGQNYHDLHLAPFPTDTAASVNAAVFAALKPGGLYVIVDHAALPGAGLVAADTLDRIDIAEVEREVEAAGFVLEAQSDLLANHADPHTANVFDPAIRGQTDQFMLRFRKPA